MNDENKKETDTVNKEQEKSLCVQCLEPINTGAKKCPACGSFQKFNRDSFLSSFNLVLSIIVAFSVVLPITWVFIKDTFNKKLDVNIAIVDVKNHHLSVLVSNDGDIPIAIDRGVLLVKGPLPLKEGSPSTALYADLEHIVLLKPGDASIVPWKSSFVEAPNKPGLFQEHLYECEFTIHYIQAGKKVEYASDSYECIPSKNLQELHELRK